MNFMTTFGAVPVGGRNFFRLLQNGEAVLLFPGGVREVGSLVYPGTFSAIDNLATCCEAMQFRRLNCNISM